MNSEHPLSQADQITDRGYVGLAITQGYIPHNLSCLMRSALIFDVSFVVIIGGRYKRFRADTVCAKKHIPFFEIEDESKLDQYVPSNCEKVAVEMCENATDVREFKWPERSLLILGPEDGDISPGLLSTCKHKIVIPGKYCLNVAVAGSIVLYDRLKSKVK